MRTMPKLVVAAVTALALSACQVVNLYFYLPSTSGPGGAGGQGGTGGAPLCTPGATQPCYSGPAGTEGQGICKAGSQTCVADGLSWGACTGEVLPEVEDCATPEDEDCDGKAPPCKGTLQWAKRFGDIDDQQATSIATDAAGNVLVTGYYWGALDFGGGPLLSAGGFPGPSDIFVAKLDANGSHVWSKSFGGMQFDSGHSIAVDAIGDVIVAGRVGGAVDFGGGPITSVGTPDVFVAKLSADGAHVWSKGLGGTAVASSVAVDSTGNVIIAGHFYGNVDFSSTPLTSAGGMDIFIAKLNANGDLLWSKGFGDGGQQYATSVAVNGNGEVIATGGFFGTVDFGGGALVSAGSADLFVVKLDSSGSHLWSKRFGDGESQAGTAVAVNGSGDIAVTGDFSGALNFGVPPPLIGSGGTDIFVVKLDSSGAYQWAKRFGDVSDQHAANIAMDQGGNILLTGGIAGEADFGSGPLASAGGMDAFVAKLDTDGGCVWAKRFGDATEQLGQDVVADPSGNVLMTGSLYGTADLGAGPLVSAGGYDILVAKFSP